ncbi:DUF2303 family protein [Zavarzinia sp.]|uniref:DUF2303 family protein n=1 Tax=Zavarzinia sp. TaxID=2027920 RepID=UPI003BB7603C
MSTEPTSIPSGIEAVIKTMRELDKPSVLDHPAFDLDPDLDVAWTTPALLALPKGTEMRDATPILHKLLTDNLHAPRFLREAAKLTSVTSFIGYTLRFRDEHSAIFVEDTPAAPQLKVIIDYHRPASPEIGEPSGDSGEVQSWFKPRPRHGRHTGTYGFPLSEQINEWKKVSGAKLTQSEFATFLQDRRFDIANPPLDWMQMERKDLDLILRLLNLADDRGEVDDGASTVEDSEDGDERYIPRSALYKLRKLRFASADRVVQLAQSIEVTVDGKAKSGFNPRTGERQLEFEEEHTTSSKGRRVTVPEFFLVEVPLFEGERPRLIPVRLQYRVSGGTVVWIPTLIEWKRVIRLAVADVAAQVGDATGLPVLFGNPAPV